MAFDFAARQKVDDPFKPQLEPPPVRPSAPPAPTSPAPAPTAAALGAGGTHAGLSPGRGLTDPAAASAEDARAQDRARAQEELAGQFKIVPADGSGPRLPNQVTQAEYEKLCENYSDIRMGSSNIQLSTDGLAPEPAAAFRTGMMGDIASMLQTGGGRELIDALGHATAKDGTARTTSIAPKITPFDGAPSLFNMPTRDGTGWFGPDQNVYSAPGVGGNAKVAHTPGKDQQLTGPTNAAPPWATQRSDVDLFFKMAKSLDTVRGTYAGPGVDTANMELGSEPEDYKAIGLAPFAPAGGNRLSENGYRAERRLLAHQAGARPGDELPMMDPRLDVLPR